MMDTAHTEKGEPVKLIDADKILEALGVFTDKEHGDPHFLAAIASAREIIEGMPEAVVRCKDCKWVLVGYGIEDYGQPDYVCVNCGGSTSGDRYCSDGERRTDEID